MKKKFNRIGIMGVGSLGTILGAYLTKGGLEVDLIDVYKEHVQALNENGAKVIGTVDITVPVKALTPDQMEGDYDLFLYLAKQTYNDTCIPQMVSHLSPEGSICVFQNGIPENAVADVIGEDRTIGVTVGWGATFQGPGVSECTTIPEQWYFEIGTMSGEETEDVKEVKEMLELMCKTTFEKDWMSARWMKLLANCAMSGMSAALGCTFGEVLDDPLALLAAQHLARENVRVTKGLGYKCAYFDLIGTTIDKIIDFTKETGKAASDKAFMAIWGAGHRASVASMLQDIRKGRKTEIDAIVGVQSEAGRKCGVPTPVSDIVVRVVHEIEDGKREACWDNLKEFDIFDGIEVRENY